jgi:hydroxymethylbilane synthase
LNLRIGSRGSQLALWQANHIAALLRGQGHSVQIEIIKTTGDRLQEVTFAQVGAITGDKGMFTKEIEEALADGRVDLAVHSLKDLPTELPELFALAATPPRVDPRDVLVSVNFANLAALPQGARVGTSSQRRRAQLKAVRPDIVPQEFRGNVDTRLRKLAEGQVDAILLAAAGLDRLEKAEWVRERLDPAQFCPAAGQGSLGIETRKGDAATMAAVAFLDDAPTRFAVTAERAALAALGGGCQVPIGIHCRPALEPLPSDSSDQPNELANERANELANEPGAPSFSRTLRKGWEIFAVVAAPESGTAVRVFHSAPHADADAAALGRLVAQKLLEAGAGPLLAAAVGEGLR